MLVVIGIPEIARRPEILRALSPTYAAEFFINHGAVAFIALAGVVLAVTGAEALYADMGHFGRSPIRRAWFFLVFPALTINYMAQGALILRSPKAVENPFFLLTPGWAQVPIVFLATFATVIASQAVISGAYSVTQQAVQIGFLPRLTIRHTSAEHVGQIYTPAINALLFVAVLVITIGFGSSTGLASAYGVAVTGTFILSTILFLAVARLLWNKSKRVGGARGVGVPDDRGRVLLGQPDQGRPRRMAAVGRGRDPVRADDDLAPGERDSDRQPSPDGRLVARFRGGPGRAGAPRSEGAGSGRVHEPEPPDHPVRPARQRRTQPGAAGPT